MKKFISMVMAAAMVVSLVPATAFAANEATFKVVGGLELTSDEAENKGTLLASENVELQIKLKDVDTNIADKYEKFEIELDFENTEVHSDITEGATWNGGKVVRDEDTASANEALASKITIGEAAYEDTTLEVTIQEQGVNFKEGDVIVLPLSWLDLTTSKVGKDATVTVSGDFGTSDALTFIAILDKTLEIDVKDTVDVAEEEVVTLKKVTIEVPVGELPYDDYTEGEDLKLKLSKGFEFACDPSDVTVKDDNGNQSFVQSIDDDVMYINVKSAGTEELTLEGIVIEAVTAKAGDVATLKVTANDYDGASVEVATVIDYKVVMSVDEDEDVPVFYSGVNVANDGLTVDDDHEALEVNLKETFIGAWVNNKDFTLSLPEGVYVVDADVTGGMEAVSNLNKWFEDAYVEGDHVSFEFDKRTWEETEKGDTENEIDFTLTLVADPGFVGDVVLTLEGDALDTQEVTIAKFVAPMTIKAEQNDLKIDYRYTAVGTDVVVTEAEAGLWEEGLKVWFEVDRSDMIQFEDEAVYTVNEDSDMEIEDFDEITNEDGDDVAVMGFEVTEESDEVAAEVTIAKFVSPIIVKAEQNDLKNDYRY
ncbi:hypothetical protein, partial [Anaerotignum sp.]